MTAMTEFERSLELLVALGISQLSARPNNERLGRALEIVTRHLEAGGIPAHHLKPAVGNVARVDDAKVEGGTQ